MTREVYQFFSDRKYTQLHITKYELQLQEEAYTKNKALLESFEKKVDAALKMIQQSIIDEQAKYCITQAIEELEHLLKMELDDTLLVDKYGALANMLDTALVSNHAVQTKILALDQFVNSFKRPSSELSAQVKMGLMIGLLVVIVCIGIAANFIVPLIPFSIAFAWLGLSQGLLSFATVAASATTQIGGVLLAGWALQKLAEWMRDPSLQIFQRLSKEYTCAVSLKEQLEKSFIFKDVPLEMSQTPNA